MDNTIEHMNGLLFGFGRMGITHIALLNKYADKEIFWDVYEPSWKTRLIVKLFGHIINAKIVDEADIIKKNYDLSLICSPPAFHQDNYDLVKSNSAKIFLEKPGVVKSNNPNKVYVGYVLRHSPCVQYMLSNLNRSDIKSVSVEIRANTVIEDGSGWRASAIGGGVINEFGSHAINLAKFITGNEFTISKLDKDKVVSSNCYDKCHLVGSSSADQTVDIFLNWSDKTVRKPTYRIAVELFDGTLLETDLFQVKVKKPNLDTIEVSGVADWENKCKFYIRGLEFSEQARYFMENSDFSEDFTDSTFTDLMLEQCA